MKNILTNIMLAAIFATSSFAASYSTNMTAPNRFTLLSVPSRVNEVSVVNNSGSNIVVKFYNAPPTATDITYTIGAYSNYVTTVGTTTTVYTNVFGYAVTNTYPSITKTLQSIPATTNEYELLTTISVADGETTTVSPPSGFLAPLGVLATNTGHDVTITIDYTPY